MNAQHLFALTGLINGITSTILGIFVFFRNPKDTKYSTYGLFCLSISIWSYSYFFWLMSSSAESALFWSRMLMSGAIFIPVTYLHHILRLLNISKQKFELIIFGYTFSIFAILADSTPLFVSSVNQKLFFSYWPNPGILYHPFLIIWFAYVIYGMSVIFAFYQRSSGLQKNQLKYVLLATIIGWSGGTTNYPLWYNIPLPPYGNVFVSVYILITAYAIVKTRLLDIEVVIKRTAVYSILTAFLTGLFVSLILISDYFFRGLTGYSSIWPGIVGAFTIALLFQPLRDAIQKAIDRTFFRTRYDYQRILGKYSHALSRPMTNLDRFSKIAPYLLWKSMKLAGVSVMVLDRTNHCYLVRAGEGEGEKLVGLSIPENSPLIQELTTRRREISRDEIKNEAILAEMDRLKSVLIIPSISESEYFAKPTLLATTNLGKKLSDETFSQEDIAFLETLSHQAAISIEYAFILEELRKNQEQIVKSEKMAVLGTTTAGIAHELKNPLTYLTTIAQTMPTSWDNVNFKESVLKLFPSEVERMKLIIDGLSDYSKMRELKLEPTDITEVLEKVLAILSHEVKKNNIFVIRNFPKNEIFAQGDKNRLIQVFMNIISNAIQAMGPKGGDLTLAAQIYENEVHVLIADTGPGIPEDKIKKIFDPFYTTKESGNGLGLSITKKIIDEHKGSIFVSSKINQGTTFTVCLPKAKMIE